MTKRFLLILIFLLTSTLAFAAEVQSHPEKIVDIVVKGSEAISPEIAKDVTLIKPGDDFSEKRIEQSVKYLKKWGVFESIDVERTKTAEGIILTYHFKDATIIARIDIAGNYPYIENKVRKYLTIHTGDVYTDEKMEEQIERLMEFYSREGYVNTDISISEEPGPDNNSVLLTINIHRGDLLRYARINVSGNKAYPNGRFVSTINRYQPYSERRLRRSLRQLKEFYQLNGYPRAKIRIERKKIDLKKKRVYLDLKVREGPYVKVKFIGNTHISDSTLRNVITIFKEANFDSYEIEQSVNAIARYYKKHSYPHIKVASSRKRIGPKLAEIVFHIDEGLPRYIKQIDIEGNSEVSDDKLKKGMLIESHAIGQPGALLDQNIDEDSQTILDNFKKDGFIDATILPWEINLSKQGYAYEITIPVEEGNRTLVDSVEFINPGSAPKKELIKVLHLKPEKPFNPLLLDEDKENVKRFYADNGHPYAIVSQSFRIDPSSNNAIISYEIDEGKEVRVGQILIVGDVLTSQKAIKSAMQLKSGDLFSYKNLVDSQLNIRRLGAFNSVRIETIGIEEKESTVHLKVNIDEDRPFRLDVDLGYSTRDSLIGSLLFTNINSFGWAKKTFLKLTAGRKLSRAELGWRDPRFLSSAFEMSVIAWIQHRIRPTFNYVQLGGSFGFYRRYDKIGLLFLQEFTRNYFVEGDSVAADAESLRNNTISRTSMSASYDARDNFSNPTRGYYGLAKIDFFNEIKGNEAHFVKFALQAEYDYGFWKRLVFSSAGRFDDIETIGSNVSVPTNELLFMGGSDTVRGYAEDSLGPVDAQGRATGGRVRWIINEELRFNAFKNFQVAGFFDVGSLTNDFPQINASSIRMSAGAGIRYLTPVGPLRLDWGFPLDRKPNESKSRVHFTFGYVF